MRIPQTNINIDTEKIKEMAKASAQKAKVKVQEFKQQAEQTIEEGNQFYLRNFEKSKLEQLSAEKANLQEAVFKNDKEIRKLQSTRPVDYEKIRHLLRENALATQKIEKTAEKYNKFAAQQEAAQKEFERINGLK